MRTLLLMRGCPGCGKSTWIKNEGLEDYKLCADEIRMLFSSPKINIYGEEFISQEQDNEVWTCLMSILESRMQRGEFTVIDAVNSKTSDMRKYKTLADLYRYRIYIVDFTDIPIEVCKKQNKQRSKIKFVPEAAIDNIYARFATQSVPSGIKVISRDNWREEVFEKPFDLNEYEKVVHIGDLHGCYDTLMKYFEENPFNEKYEYIFTGDYLDRGNQNAETFRFIQELSNKPNVCLLEGNHEIHIKSYGYEIPANSKEFNYKTKPALENAGVTPKEARQFYRKLRQCSYYTFNGIEVLACHGGIPTLSTNLLFIPTHNIIKGVGTYEDVHIVDDSWIGNTKDNQYLIHGHRNVLCDETQYNDRVFNLEGGIEDGGYLRIVELSRDGFKTIEIENCQPVNSDMSEECVEKKIDSMTMTDIIALLRSNKFISEKKLTHTISSFNFTREAFYRGNWNKQTILARGLFIDTCEEKVVARSYPKFFNLNERAETQLGIMKQSLEFPLYGYLKENGFLGMISYNNVSDDFLIASKSSITGDCANIMKNMIDKNKSFNDNLKNYLKNNDCTLVCEIVNNDKDPHIIKYDEPKIVVLDVIKNDIQYEKLQYSDLVKFCKEYDLEYKRLVNKFDTWDEFFKFYNLIEGNEEYTLDNKYIEGFVFEDSNGFMFKYKTEYYKHWRHLRSVSEITLKHGYYTKTGELRTSEDNYFYAFCKKLYENDFNRDTKSYPYKTDIISLREKFYNER